MSASASMLIVLGFLVVIAGICWACYRLSATPKPEGFRQS